MRHDELRGHGYFDVLPNLDKNGNLVPWIISFCVDHGVFGTNTLGPKDGKILWPSCILPWLASKDYCRTLPYDNDRFSPSVLAVGMPLQARLGGLEDRADVAVMVERDNHEVSQ